jgi:tol-pal system protein YbgF
VRRHFLSLALLIAPAAFAQVEVVEPGGAPAADYGATGLGAQTRRPAPQSAASASGELFYQLQLLQDEVMQLRGIVEEQGEQLRQLKQQRLDDYISLDRRIGALGGGSTPPGGASGGGGTTGAGAASAGAPIDASAMPTPPPAAAARGPATPQEEQAYQAAYELVRARKFPDATAAFKKFVGQFPEGNYAGNAHYWLGELYLLDGDSAAAKKEFETLLKSFGDNRRVPDAMFKLGRIYHQDGDNARAKEMLQRVVNEYAGSDSTAPRLAREYLQQNF